MSVEFNQKAKGSHNEPFVFSPKGEKMKLKTWLKEIYSISQTEFQQLPKHVQLELQREHRTFCQQEAKRKSHHWIPVPDEELAILKERAARERKRYSESLKIGGIDELGNYTALHHRYDLQ